MNFKKHRIKQQLKNCEQSHKSEANFTSNKTSKSNSKLVNISVVLIGILIIIGLFWLTIQIISSINFGSLVLSFGKELKKDTNQHSNFLLTGVGGTAHDGANLTDTIIIASFDNKTKTVKMLSLPRDLYINDKITGGQRINKVYDTYLQKYKNSREAMERLGQTITDLTGIEIHYTIKVDFQGFVRIVDALDGVDVVVEKAIHDPYYPRGETIHFETFSLAAGPQHLDGKTALKYARSRKTTSDFDRAKRQQQLLTAIKDKAFNLNILNDPGKIQNIYNSLADSIETNLSVAEIIELAKLSQDIDRDKIESQVLTDKSNNCGGLLYTPVREYFGGASVLLPAGEGYSETKRFSDNYFNKSFDRSLPIHILNGTKISGLALLYLNRLSRDCLNVTYYGNAPDRTMEKSVIRFTPGADAKEQIQIDKTLEIIKQTINAPTIDVIPEEYLEGEKRSSGRIIIELGSDFKEISTKDPFTQLQYTTKKSIEKNNKTSDSNKTPTENSKNQKQTNTESQSSSTP